MNPRDDLGNGTVGDRAVAGGGITGPLAELAAARGVQSGYIGVGGEERTASPESVVAVLAAMGVPIDHPDGAVEALRAEGDGPRPPIGPVVAHWAGSTTPVTVTLPHGVHPRDVWLTLELEGGERSRRRLLAAVTRPLGGEHHHGRPVDRYEARLAPDGGGLPAGYHHVTVEVAGEEHRSLVVAAPRCPLPARGWGAFLPLHAARGAHDRGIGTYTDLAGLSSWIGGLGGSYLGTLPLLPTFLDGDPVDPSPYLPVSRLAWNEVYVDPTALPEFERCPESKQAWGSTPPPGPGPVDYAGVLARLRATVAPMARLLLAGDTARRRELAGFVAAHPHLEPYAAFRAARAGVGPDHERFAEMVGEELYLQWAADTQLAAAAGTGLYLDLPVGVVSDGFDPVWEPEAFVAGVRGGAPPDTFFEAGQDWGFPPPDPHGLRAHEYRYLIASLRHLMRHAAVVRLDHVMGLRRLFWIPEGGRPDDGVYVSYPHDELRAVVALEASRSGTAVVGEDLGTVPDGLRSDMAHDHMLRSWVLQFESSAEEPLPTPPRVSMASWGTHDLPTFAAYWRGDEPDRPGDSAQSERRRWRHALTDQLEIRTDQPEQALRGCLGHLAAGPALLTTVDLEDLWFEAEPQNRPGTGPEAGNWRRRAARTLTEMSDDPAVAATLSVVDGLRRAGAAADRRIGSTGIAPAVPATRRNP